MKTTPAIIGIVFLFGFGFVIFEQMQRIQRLEKQISDSDRDVIKSGQEIVSLREKLATASEAGRKSLLQAENYARDVAALTNQLANASAKAKDHEKLLRMLL